ncbi:four-carbon acid sugar kinase family protein [Achromobacter xylosoxidans]
MNTQKDPAKQVGIIADDLTSAADGAGPFMEWAGVAHISRGGLTRSDAPVLSVDTGSRALGEAEAGQVVGRAARALADCGTLYKTMDSTLRGHVREELSAAFRASRRQLLVVAPAFPDAGRLTLGGNQYVHGKLVAASSYGQDPVHPARTSRILDLVDPALGPAIVVPEDASVAELRAAANKARVLVLDASSQQVLNDRVAQLSLHACLWAGSPGMAQALAFQLGARRRAAGVAPRVARAGRGGQRQSRQS